MHHDCKSIEEETIWEEGGGCNVTTIVWSDTSYASYSQPHILRASVHQKIHEQDVVFGKVLGFELMILKCLSRQPIWYCNNIYNLVLRYHIGDRCNKKVQNEQKVMKTIYT